MAVTITIDRWPHDPSGLTLIVQVHRDGVATSGPILTRDEGTVRALVCGTIARALRDQRASAEPRAALTDAQLRELRARLDRDHDESTARAAAARHRARISGRHASRDDRPHDEEPGAQGVAV